MGTKIKEVAEFVNNEKKIAENMLQLTEIDEMIAGGANLVSREREFIQEGELFVPQKSHEKHLAVHYFLFSDIFVLLKRQSGSKGIITASFVKNWKLLEREPLMSLEIDDSKEDKTFRMTTSKGTIRFEFESREDCSQWLADFYEVRARAPGAVSTPKTEPKKKKKP